MKVLWLSPNLNHYKARFLDKLNSEFDLEITVLAGTGNKEMGYVDSEAAASYRLIQLNVRKPDFGFSGVVRKQLRKIYTDFDWILIPKENKNLLLFLYAFALKYTTGKKIRLVSYNHHLVTSGPRKTSWFNRIMTRFYYSLYDRIVFYTLRGRDEMVNQKLIRPEVAFGANNTIDTEAIQRVYKFTYPEKKEPTILFIGRLIPSKYVNVCIDYYFKLKARSGLQKLKLIIVGDGPDAFHVKAALAKDPTIEWKGAVIDEEQIQSFMTRTSLVFVPGASGLSINHAFCYGRPYFTLSEALHGPELAYIDNGKNGFILGRDESQNIKTIEGFLLNFEHEYYNQAFETGKKLSVEHWCRQFYAALTN
jgi:glycosyltransferase involved in cell wall biosynthesis